MSSQSDPPADHTPSVVPLIPQPPPTERARPIAILADDDFVRQVLIQMWRRSGLTQRGISERMGVKGNLICQYVSGTIKRPSLQWFSRFAQACGGKLLVELPPKERK